jgi:arylsulfatase A-like enzyme
MNNPMNLPACSRRSARYAALCWALTVAGGALGSACAADTPPNVIFVIADEWRAQALGYAGDANASTPTIDRFARQSCNFERAVSGCSVCCPARASLMTGQYPLTHGVYINDVPLRPKGVTLGEAFQKAGYATGYIGKWHLYGSPGGHLERREDFVPPADRFGFEYWKAAECCHDYNNSFYYEGDDRTEKYWPGYDAIAQTQDACRFVRDHAHASSPYLLFLSWGPPHFPLYTAPEQYQARYRTRELQMRPNVPADKRVVALQELRGYYAHIAALDDCFQQLMATLEATGTAENTIVVFTADHGDMMESQGLTYKTLPWDESIRIPLLIRYPKKYGTEGRRSEALISSPDFMPTLLTLSGIPIPAGVQGQDYSSGRAQGSAYLDVPVPELLDMYGIAEYRGVRTERYTFVQSIKGPWLLYDDQADPYQMHNLCGRPEAKQIQTELENDLTAWRTKLDDRFLPAADYLKRDDLNHHVETKFPIGHVRSPWGDWESTSVKPRGPLNSKTSSMGDLLDNPKAKAILLRDLPQLTSRPAYIQAARMFSAWQLQQNAPYTKTGFRISDEDLRRLDDDLAQLPPHAL